MYLHNSRRVRVLLTTDDLILLQRSSFGTQRWSLPGGGIARRERAEDAAIRETAEEVGIELTQAQLQYVGTRRMTVGKGPGSTEVLFYRSQLAKPAQAVIVRPLEVLEVGWFKRSQLPENCSETVALGLGMVEADPSAK